MAEMEIVPVYRGNEMVLPITGVNAVMDGEGNNLPMIFAKKDATTSDAWDPDITYTTGQYCLDNNTLWRCLIQNENTKPTEGTYWTRETIGNNLVTTDGEGNRGYLKADGSFSPFSNVEFISDKVFYMVTTTPNRGGVTFNQDFTIPKKGKHLVSITTYQDHPLIKTLNSAKTKDGVQFPVLLNSAYIETTEDNQVITFNITCNKSASNYYYIGVQCSGFTV